MTSCKLNKLMRSPHPSIVASLALLTMLLSLLLSPMVIASSNSDNPSAADLSTTNKVNATHKTTATKLKDNQPQPPTPTSNHNRAVDSSIFFRHYPSNIGKQREHYRQALQALNNKQDSKYQTHRAALNYYTLAGYLDYQYLAQNIASTSIKEINTFQQNYSNRNFATARWIKKLSHARLNYLAKRQNWPAYLSLYNDKISSKRKSTSLQCHYAQAMYQNKQQAEALKLAKTLWLTPQSMPKTCDPIFAVFTDRSSHQDELGITAALAWQRFTAAFAKNEVTLAKYLQRYLNDSQLTTAELLIELYKQPLQIPKQWATYQTLSQKNINPQLTNDISLLLLKRLARKHETEAVKFIRKQKKQRYANTQQQTLHQQLYNKLSIYTLKRHALKDYNDLDKLYKKLGSPNDTASIEWMLRSYLATANWRKVTQLIALLPTSKQAEDRWRYWSIRAAQLRKPLNEKQQFNLQQLAEKTNFYGFFAAKHLDIDFHISSVEQILTADDIDQLLSQSGIKLALEYFIQDQTRLAHQEWVAATRNFDKQQRINAAYLAYRFGWYNQAISTAATAKAWQHYAIRFPDFMSDAFAEQALRLNHPPQWFYATARQESALAEKASSSAGALGLMQVLPKTAAAQAKSLNIDYQKSSLYDPSYSITIGTSYLAKLYNRYGNRALSSAAYNAGPHRVDQWLGNLRKPIPLDAWIETIRYAETRQYVQNILSFSLIHARLHEASQGNINPWPSFVFAEPSEMLINPLPQQVAKNAGY